MSDSAAAYISSRADSAPNAEVASTLSSIKDLYEKKLWHQLTELVKTAVNDDAIPDKRGLYESFLKHFEAKLNPVSLVQIVTSIVRVEFNSSPTDALQFIKPLSPDAASEATNGTANTNGTATATAAAAGTNNNSSSMIKSPLSRSPEAQILLHSLCSTLHMAAGDKGSSKKSIEEARTLVDSGQGAAYDLQPAVHSAYYKAAAEYHKVVGTASEFFRNALQFLAYTPPETLSSEDQLRWAFDIGIAALVGTDVYNFGEVVSRSIIQRLRGTDHEWLLTVLEAFHQGDLEKYAQVCSQASQQMNSQQVLVNQQDFLKQKITILALLELAFSSTLQHSISFKEIEKNCRLPLGEVEHLLMRCMSLGLITGVIDNVDETVSISRVQPRVLDREPIGGMAARLKAWCGNVDTTVSQLKQTGVGLIE